MMPAVTQNTTPSFNVVGNKRQQFYNITGASGDTLDVGMTSVLKVNTDQPAVITSYTVTAATPSVGQSRITFTAGGAITAANVEVLGS
jgi:hypothetical protein